MWPGNWRLTGRYWMRTCIVVLWCVVWALWPTAGLCGEQGVVVGMTAAHNRVRAALGLPGLAWSDDLAALARDWADYLAREKGCDFAHHGGDWPYGENLFWASAIRYGDGRREVQPVTAEHVVRSWAAEVEDYDYQANRCRIGRSCGHYTQVVWRDSRRLGCGRSVCADSGQIWVCTYDPPGNFIGRKPY